MWILFRFFTPIIWLQIHHLSNISCPIMLVVHLTFFFFSHPLLSQFAYEYSYGRWRHEHIMHFYLSAHVHSECLILLWWLTCKQTVSFLNNNMETAIRLESLLNELLIILMVAFLYYSQLLKRFLILVLGCACLTCNIYSKVSKIGHRVSFYPLKFYTLVTIVILTYIARFNKDMIRNSSGSVR